VSTVAVSPKYEEPKYEDEGVLGPPIA